MIEKLRFLNPLKPLPSGQEIWATRVSAVALLVLAVESLWSVVWGWLQRDVVLSEMRQVVDGHIARPDVAEATRDIMGPGLVQGMLVFGLVQALLFAVLGAVQWRTPNRWILLIIFLFFAYSLLSIPQMLYLTGFQVHSPPWGLIWTVVETAVLLLIFWGGFRGADRLGKLRIESTSADPPALSVR